MIYLNTVCYNNLNNIFKLKGGAAVKKLISAFAFVLAVCMLLSSCGSSDLIRPVDTLLSPPLYHEEYESLVEAFRKEVSKTTVLCSPRKGDYRSAIILEDLDSNGENEALVFYRDSIDSSFARLHYFNIVDGEWTSRGDFNGYGNEIEKTVLADMDGDGKSEIVVIWKVSGVATSSIMSVYRAGEYSDSYKELSNEMCTLCEVVDIDGDSREDIFYANQTSVLGISQRSAKVIKISGDGIVLLGEAKMDPNISSYTSVKTEKATGDSPLRIYIDALKGESQMITELVYWDGEKSELCAPMLDTETMSNVATLRYHPIASADVNNDGIIDIPVQSVLLEEDNSDNSAAPIYLTEWRDYSDGELNTVAGSVVNFEDGYMINLDEDEFDTTAIRDYKDQDCWVVCKKESRASQSSEMYSVLRISNERWNEDEFDAYIPLIERDDSIICAYITRSGAEMGIKEKDVSEKVVKIPA